ncbi:uncharacterized protein [Nicotiana sylvestris]|uniref:uncharacterized protein n=1 Tax=Nicotiana sylvestris TaxID=4096 RepID=UPI00388C619B
MGLFVRVRNSSIIPAEKMPFPEEWNMKMVSWVPSAIPNLEGCVRKLTSTSSYTKCSWRDLSRGRWEAKNHGIRDNAVMRSSPLGEEEAPKPAKDKKRRRVSPSDTPKPKKNKAQKEKEDADYELAARKRGSAEASKVAVKVEEAHLRTEEISEDGPRKVHQSSEAKDVSRRDEQSMSVPVRRDEQSADVPEGSSSEALREGESAPSVLLGAINIDDSPPLPTFSTGKNQEEAFSKSGAELNQCEADLKRLAKERNALKLFSGQKEEEIKDLRDELAKAHKEQIDLIEQVQQKTKKIEQLREEAKMKEAETLG